MLTYKLTDQNDRTYNKTQWGINITHTASGQGNLCSPSWIHCYTDPLIAVFMNPIHGNFELETAHMWECEAEGIFKYDYDLKMGCSRLTTIKQISIPIVTMEQRIRFAIKAAYSVYKEESWVKWAQNWILNKDRTKKAAWAAWKAAGAAWEAAREAARAVNKSFNMKQIIKWAMSDSMEL